jgi:hypothetical protein
MLLLGTKLVDYRDHTWSQEATFSFRHMILSLDGTIVEPLRPFQARRLKLKQAVKLSN